MKPASDVMQGFEYVRRDLEQEHASDKYDNRDVAALSLGGWTTARNSGGKIAMAGAEVPTNESPEGLAEGYAAAFER